MPVQLKQANTILLLHALQYTGFPVVNLYMTDSSRRKSTC